MSGYTVAHLDEIEEASDGRCPWRPVRQHFGITAFGASAWTGRNVGDRIINEHDEREREPGHLRAGDVEEDANEELYLVHRGRARFELDGDQVDAPAGTFVFVPPGVRRTAFAEEPGTTIVAVGGIPGKAYEPVRTGTQGAKQRLRVHGRFGSRSPRPGLATWSAAASGDGDRV
jgi:hypothetical protein